ncbi:MAG TPA: hypothetical protein VHC95_02885 [Opitutales bacterium]|nr:hypothetical protein [Opitutales bacterium]
MQVCPIRVVSRLAAAVIVFGAAGAGVAQAQVRHNDYTLMNSQFTPQQPASFYMDPSSIASQLNPGMQRFIGRAPNLDKFLSINQATLPKGNLTFGNSSLNGRMDPNLSLKDRYPLPPSLANKMYPGSTDTRQPMMDSTLQGKYSIYNDSGQPGGLMTHTAGPSKFTDAFVFHTADKDTPQLEQVGRELSLQDINRYQFQGSFSSQPGLPSTHAGDPNASQPTFSGSALTSGPATFDGGALQSGRVLSGTSNQLRVITPNGSQPYQPMLLGASGNNLASGSSPAPANRDAPTQSAPKNNDFETVYSQTHDVATSAANPGSQKVLPQTAFMPSGTYTPKTAGGTSIPMTFDEPRVIIQVKKGGFVGLDTNPLKPPTGEATQAP